MAPPPVYAQTILRNGRFLTMDPEFSTCEAVAIRDGRFLAVGPEAEVMEWAGPDTTVEDLAGRCVLPGLIDTHIHVDLAGLDLWSANFDGVTDVAGALERVAEAARQVAPGTWIRGATWHPVSQLAEGRYLTRDELDKVAPDHPVCLPVSHFTMVNSRALEAAGIDESTPDPEGGIIHRDPGTGRPTGLLEESAEEIVFACLPEWTDADREAQLRDAMALCNSHGLTSVVSAAVGPDYLRAHQGLLNRGDATLRVSCMFAPTGNLNPGMSLEEWEAFFSRIGAMSEFGNEWLSYAAVKLQIDGGMTLGTALMRDGYPHDPDYHGTVVIEPERFHALVRIANRYGWRVGVHAVGDAAIDLVLDAYEAADEDRPIPGRRFIVIHGSLMRPDQMDRARRLDVRVDAQSTFLWGKAKAVADFLGKETADRAFPMRTMIDRMGLDLLGQGTDYPINALSPFVNMAVMVTRRDRNGVVYGSEEAITREEALRLYTSAAARYAFREAEVGTIEPGKRADLAVLSDDILTVPDEDIAGVTVLRTILGGETVHG
ncbi:amidohydrolase family protein [Aquicoccus sp. SCR17]|nr:amidohydrolase family protein [Carideicomes alvinocaridis]